jgi:HSP20 family protein
MTKLVRWTPLSAPRTLDQVFDQVWRNAWNETPARYYSDTALPVVRPAMDVSETEAAYEIQVDLPGLDPEHINVEVEGDLLTISGEIEATEEQEGERYHYRERRFGAFKRSLRLPETVDTDHIDAAFDNGVLHLSLPKLPETQPKRIRIEAN